MMWGIRLFLAAAVSLSILSGCTTVPLESSIQHFRRGNIEEAEKCLDTIPDDANAVLHLMERGMIRQLRHDFAGSTADLRRAIQIEEALETHSVSKAGASMLVNDSVLAYRGLPYERTYLHVFQARNFLAQGLWEDAAVEARNIIRLQEKLDGFADDSYSRYMAGLCLMLAGDPEAAAFQYQLAAAMQPESLVQPGSGTGGAQSVTAANLYGGPGTDRELICLLDMDNAWGINAGAELYAKGKFLGTARVLTDTHALQLLHQEKMAGRRMAKTVARIALKEVIAEVIAAHNKDLGESIRYLLFVMETPDARQWRTLPRLLAVARVPCPPDLTSFDVVFRGCNGTSRITVSGPIARRNQTVVSFCRDYP